MDKRIVITISREYGSGGKIIGKLVADKLGIEFYDRKIIEMAAEKSGLSMDFVEKTEQKMKSKFLHSIAMGSYYMNGRSAPNELALPDRVFVETCNIIRGLAEKSCVIVGRCADYVLQGRDDVINIFIYSDLESKKQRAIQQYNIAPDKVEDEVKKHDKYRANHYNYYTDRVWGKKANYHLCLNSGFLGAERTADIIVEAAKEYIGKQ